jgi:predicted KAP-like P-loop ATPase
MSEVDDKKISGDRPITNPDGDILGYKAIARHLADRIMTAADPEGFTIAIYGEWGSGKTSLLNMTNFFLGEREKSEQPIVVAFNPWWFSGHEELAREFFIALRTGLESQPGIGEAVRVALNSLGNLVSYIPYEQVARLGKGLSELTSKSEKTVPQLKTEISNELRKLGRTIVVTIDDLDRLTAEEIRQVFRVVKAVADFPNVIYLMAFDQEIVAKALSDPNGLSGKSFLEKIVQVPIALPAIDRTALKKMLFKQLDELEPNPDPARFDATHWGNVFLDGIEPLLATPRHVVRLINALRFTYPAVREEVNFVDFVAVETLRIFCPKAYELVKDNPEMFLRTATHGQASEKELANALDPVLADCSKTHEGSDYRNAAETISSIGKRPRSEL